MKGAGMKGAIIVDLARMPETLWTMCNELAGVLREEAKEESDAYTQGRLLEIAAMFECGANNIEWPEIES